MEHRWGHRVPVDLEVRLRRTPSGVGRGRLRNISTTGAYVTSTLALPPLSHVSVEALTKAGAHWPVWPISAYVVWSDPAGAGLEWCEPLSDDVESTAKHHSAARDKARIADPGGARVDR